MMHYLRCKYDALCEGGSHNLTEGSEGVLGVHLLSEQVVDASSNHHGHHHIVDTDSNVLGVIQFRDSYLKWYKYADRGDLFQTIAAFHFQNHILIR